MKLIHLSDLHLGKKVNEFSMLEDQDYILREILRIIAEESPDAVIIAGDIYDRPVPPAEAVRLFDSFLCELSALDTQVFVISGNHDSAERIAFGSRLMDKSGIHMSPVCTGEVRPFTLTDEFGEVCIYMLPFIKPATVRGYFPDSEINSYTDAVNAVIDAMDVDFTKRNIITAHQFVTGASGCDSEEVSVGGIDNVELSAFDGFDYVALGHIHSPQNIGSERVRYCGTPLKYSFSEAKHEKSVTVAELHGKGELRVRTVPLVPMRDMREIRGTFEEVTAPGYYSAAEREDYLHITLTDEEDILEALGKLRVVYPNLMKLDYDNKRTRSAGVLPDSLPERQTSPLELFKEFYLTCNGSEMDGEQLKLADKLIKKIWEGEEK